MSGIVGYIGKHEAVPIILEGLKQLEYRGYDSAGLAVYGSNSQFAVRRASGKLCNLEESLRISPIGGTFGIGHTRWAIHGGPPNRTPTRTAIAEARSWWCITASSKTTWA